MTSGNSKSSNTTPAKDAGRTTPPDAKDAKEGNTSKSSTSNRKAKGGEKSTTGSKSS